MKSKIVLLLAAIIPAIASAAPTYLMKVPSKGLVASSAASTPSSTGGTTTPAAPAVTAPEPALTGPEISYGGLTIVKANSSTVTYAAATSVCAGTINSKTGWRVPTYTELYNTIVGAGASAFTSAGYDMSAAGWIWTSSLYRAGTYVVVRPMDKQYSVATDNGTDAEFVACVR